MSKEEIRETTLHDFLLDGCWYCVTFRYVVGDTETISFVCYPTKRKALRAKSIFKHDSAWRELTNA